MHTAIQPKETFFHHTHLDEEQMRDPLSAIHYFCEWYHLQDLRGQMWDWLVAALSAGHIYYGDADAREELLFLFEKLVALLEAVFLVEDRNITLANCMVEE